MLTNSITRPLIFAVALVGMLLVALKVFIGDNFLDWRSAGSFGAESRPFATAAINDMLTDCTVEGIRKKIAPSRRAFVNDAYIERFCSSLSQQFGRFEVNGGAAPSVAGYLTDGVFTWTYFGSALFAGGAPLIWVAVADYDGTWFVVDFDNKPDDLESGEAGARQFAKASLELLLRNCTPRPISIKKTQFAETSGYISVCQETLRKYGAFQRVGDIKRQRGKQSFGQWRFALSAIYDKGAAMFNMAVGVRDGKPVIEEIQGF